ncbi:MAG: IclR family transcriptional regulator [Armatimonadota bacterium]
MQSVQRALAVLKAFDDGQPELGISQLSRKLGLSKSIVMRLVATLRDDGFLERSSGSDKYRIGLNAFEVGNLYYVSASLRREAELLLQGLAEQLGYGAYLGTLSGGRAVYVSVMEGPGPIRVGPRIGSSAPAHTTAAGKALLAYLPPEDLERYLAMTDLEPETPQSITSKTVLRDELKHIRAHGFAMNRGEHLHGVGAIGAPIFDRNGAAVASISVAFPLYLVPEDRWPSIAAAVMETAQGISRRLGTMAGPGSREPVSALRS